MPDLALLKDLDVKGKIALVRVDHNVVKKGKIIDPYRIDASLPTLRYLLQEGARIILMSHVGRPRDKKTGEIKISDDTSIEPVVAYLREAGFNAVAMTLPDYDANGISKLKGGKEIKELKAGKYDIVYLPNTRWFTGEEGDEKEKKALGKQLAALADVFVNDAFGSWQPHASTIEPARHLPSCAGFLMEKEISHLNDVLKPARPFVAVVAGSKFDTKIEPLYALLEKADFLVLGGVIYNAYLCARYGFMIKGVSEEDLEAAAEFVEFSKRYRGKIVELQYIVESDSLDSKKKGSYRTHDIKALGKGDFLNYVLDIDPRSFLEKKTKKTFAKANTIFVNAVMGLTPLFTEGTIALDETIHANNRARKLFGGGDTLQELNTLLPEIYQQALINQRYYFFTGGGTILKVISEKSPYGLEPVKVLLKP
ncbi:MAG: phosphoglycerate kinase [Candidatus Cloacimonetes bacterium]|nr:phosphoglycerate kinase [Candidatus Cloacimonadota bacterium]